MAKWELTNGDKKEVFTSFDDATRVYRLLIKKLMEENPDALSGGLVPFQIEAFFGRKYDDGSISDEDIVVSERLSMLLDSFMWLSKEDAKQRAVMCLPKDICYHDTFPPFSEEVKITISKKDGEIVLLTEYNDECDKVFIETNSFIFDDDSKEYYFKAHLVVNTSSIKENLGKTSDINLGLRRID